MKKYDFLLKPIFFILKLLFSCWLVFQIEEISPSDFGKYESLFNNGHQILQKGSFDQLLIYDRMRLSSMQQRQIFLKKVCDDYKQGSIDSTILNQQLEKLLKSDNKSLSNRRRNALK